MKTLKPLFFGTVVFLVSIFIGLVMAEFLARQILKFQSQPDYLETIRDSVLTKERLWAPNLDIEYDIRGLYEGATKSRLRTSSERLIEPFPRGKHRYHVLFLGGSTTESLYVDEKQRWVALIHKPGELAAYNGGQSGANTVDAYYAYDSLIKKGLKFDLVVLLTLVNDLSWETRFADLGRHLKVEGYHEALKEYYQKYHENLVPWIVRCARQYALCRYVMNTARIKEERKTVSAIPGSSIGTVTALYISKFKPKPEKTYEVDEIKNEIDKTLTQYRKNAVGNIGALRNLIQANGAKLLVMTESSSYGAKPESFYRFLRGSFSLGEKPLSDKAEVEFFRQAGKTYLSAAEEAGALTYDLAAAMNGSHPDAGKYFYDEFHYTQLGSQKVANLIGSQVMKVLEANSSPKVRR